MKRQLFVIATGATLGAAALLAQQSGEPQPAIFNFQSVNTIGGGVVLRPATRTSALVTNSPMSAKEVNKTVQTLSDGTQLENTTSTMFYRDSKGRTRIEPVGNDGPIQIVDPVDAVRITLMPATREAMRMQAPALAGGGRGGAAGIATADALKAQYAAAAEDMAKAKKLEAEATVAAAAQPRAGGLSKIQPNIEDLGFQMQNGVLAQGTRTTITIPQGQIGNNRDIHVVNERWYSKDLQMMVKSINTDPRYGVTTYDLQNISQNAPDPTLFQVPTGYSVTEGGRGARGGVAR